MPSDPKPEVALFFTLEFKRNLRHLAKKYPHIATDLGPILEALGKAIRLGDKIPGVTYDVYKVRARNSDSRKGKSGGYRVIYWAANPSKVVLVTLYSKSEQGDVPAKTIKRILDEFKQP